MGHIRTAFVGSLLTAALSINSGPALADLPGARCGELPTYTALTRALSAVVALDNGGFNLDMWATLVNRDGIVCAVTFSGGNRGDQWPGSRVISAQKANTANAFSLPGLALSTANLWTATQPGGTTFINGSTPPPGPPSPPIPGGSLFGLQFSNPVNTDVAYAGPATAFGTDSDPMEGGRIGGVNVFGGGLAIYNSAGELLGAVGVSGDSSCADHNIAWRVRDTLGLDYVPGGVNPDTGDDNIIYDVAATNDGNAVSPSGFGHPECEPSDAADNEAIVDVCPTGDGMSPDCLDDVLGP